MIPEHPIEIAGLPIPSDHPLFLSVLAVHVLFALISVTAGALAMFRRKQRGGHSKAGTWYYWTLLVVFISASALAVMRWTENRHLFVIGLLAFSSATFGRTALRRRWEGWVRLHISGMGASYIFMLTAFYIDNGPHLPLWKELPTLAFWSLPALVGLPIMIRALLRHPLVHSAPPTGIK